MNADLTDLPPAHPDVDRLVELMRLAPQGDDRFVAESDDIGTPALFGGQVLGQALMAACLTAPPERRVHSLHAYFLLPGEHAPVSYEVDRVRDGGSFSTRRVTAIQKGHPIFTCSAFATKRTASPSALTARGVPKKSLLRRSTMCRA